MTTRLFGILLVVVGSLLVAIGINATHSAVETLHEGVTGRFTQSTTWYLVGGIAAVLWGAVLAMRGGRGGRGSRVP